MRQILQSKMCYIESLKALFIFKKKHISHTNTKSMGMVSSFLIFIYLFIFLKIESV